MSFWANMFVWVYCVYATCITKSEGENPPTKQTITKENTPGQNKKYKK